MRKIGNRFYDAAGHPVWIEKDGKGEGCLHWDCEHHIRHTWTGRHPESPATYGARVIIKEEGR